MDIRRIIRILCIIAVKHTAFLNKFFTEFSNLGEDELSAEKTRVRPKKKLKPNPDSDDESPERKPLGLLSNMTRAPIIGIILIGVQLGGDSH